jgi:hypothetical protein
MQHMYQHDQQWYDPLHINTWPYWFIDLDFTCSLSLLWSIGTKSSLNLPFTLATGPSSQVMSWSSLPWSHDSMSCLMCNELLHHHMCKLFNISKLFHLYGICCSHTYTCGLITCVSHSNTISPSKVVTQLPKPNKDLSISPFLLIDDNSTKIWNLSSNGFMLLAQAILPCVNDFGQVPQTRVGSISSPYICAIVFGLKLAHMHRLELWESNYYQWC